MMVEFKWISLFLPAVLQFTAAAENLPLSFTVRVGDDVTLPCENVKDGQKNCEYTIWLFSGSGSRSAVALFEHGQIHNEAKSKSDRLSVTENCSLVIKKVTVEDVGRYYCRQFKSWQQQAPDSLVHLSVITMTERKDADEVTLTCSVSTREQFCRHTVKWLYEGKDVDKDNKDMKSSQDSVRLHGHRVTLFNTTVTDILDTIAPLKLKRSKLKVQPWLNSETRALRQECWKAERNWKKNKLQVYTQP
ncbi:uncharacterized protein LOC123979991 [Micropterus dolomieu]|uniref:uncharacterized protein LOC123979991 n=1 Tax=Micropterus dolomieu TaxID=147949 RepID=UPI001E8CEAC1|nr:uncharacterized protein LOC123979991 [Micropterus dolomieu]